MTQVFVKLVPKVNKVWNLELELFCISRCKFMLICICTQTNKGLLKSQNV